MRMRWCGLAAAGVVLAACAAGPAAGGGSPAPFAGETQWRGSQSDVRSERTVVARDPQAWQDLWDLAGRTPPRALPDGAMAIAVFMAERRTGGYAIEIDSVDREAGGAVVRYRIREPAPGSMVTQALTAPYVVRLVPAAPGEVRFVRVE
jgi:hypothetical protein